MTDDPKVQLRAQDLQLRQLTFHWEMFRDRPAMDEKLWKCGSEGKLIQLWKLWQGMPQAGQAYTNLCNLGQGGSTDLQTLLYAEEHSVIGRVDLMAGRVKFSKLSQHKGKMIREFLGLRRYPYVKGLHVEK